MLEDIISVSETPPNHSECHYLQMENSLNSGDVRGARPERNQTPDQNETKRQTRFRK